MAATVGNFSASSDVPQKYMLYICDKLWSYLIRVMRVAIIVRCSWNFYLCWIVEEVVSIAGDKILVAAVAFTDTVQRLFFRLWWEGGRIKDLLSLSNNGS